MRDLNRFVRRSGDAIGGATGQEAPAPLSAEDIEQVEPTWCNDPTFDVYVGKEDEIIRRVSGRLEFEVPEDDREGLGGLEGGTLTFSIELLDVNGDQEIEAPANARPLSDLTDSLGADALGGLTGGGDGATPVVPDDPDPPSPGGSDGGTADAEAFRLRGLPRQGTPRGHGRATGVRRPAPAALGRRRCVAQVALGVDSPALRQLGLRGAERPAVGALLALVVGRGALEQHRAGVVAGRADLRHLLGRERRSRRGTAASSARLASIGLAAGPASWISVGATQSHRRVGEVPGAGQLEQREPVALGDRAHARRASRAPPRPSRRGGKRRWSPCANSCPGSTSSWKRPP